MSGMSSSNKACSHWYSSHIFTQDKKGNVILPAEDDSMLNDAEESLLPTLETRVLLKQPGSIKIIVRVHLCQKEIIESSFYRISCLYSVILVSAWVGGLQKECLMSCKMYCGLLKKWSNANLVLLPSKQVILLTGWVASFPTELWPTWIYRIRRLGKLSKSIGSWIQYGCNFVLTVSSWHQDQTLWKNL